MLRTPVRAQRNVPARMITYPAPRRGWIRNENLANNKPEGAYVLDNWFPTATGARIRRGSELYATIGAGLPTRALMTYTDGNTVQEFAANDTAIYDITAVADPLVSPAAAVSGLSGGEWISTQFATSGGIFLVAVNGADPRQLYDGAAWSTTPTITAAGAAAFSYVWSFKERLFFIERDTLNFWYLLPNSIGGTATMFPLGGVFKRGGALLIGATWSIESGTGLSESCVFITTEGEVAIYEGTDPNSASDWLLKGVYRIGRPMGRRGSMKAGGDLAIATDIGLVPLSQALTRDQAALSASALSYAIEEEWNKAVSLRYSAGWSVEMWPTEQMAMVALPASASQEKVVFVVNIRTAAWSRYTGWDATCLGVSQETMRFGTNTGQVITAEKGGSDQGLPYTAAAVLLFDHQKAPGRLKVAKQMRATFRTTVETLAKYSVSTNYTVKLPTVPSAAVSLSGANAWDVGLWGQAKWSAGVTKRTEAAWRSVSGAGFALAPQVQITVGGQAEPDIEIVSMDLQFDVGNAVA